MMGPVERRCLARYLELSAAPGASVVWSWLWSAARDLDL